MKSSTYLMQDKYYTFCSFKYKVTHWISKDGLY